MILHFFFHPFKHVYCGLFCAKWWEGSAEWDRRGCVACLLWASVHAVTSCAAVNGWTWLLEWVVLVSGPDSAIYLLWGFRNRKSALYLQMGDSCRVVLVNDQSVWKHALQWLVALSLQTSCAGHSSGSLAFSSRIRLSCIWEKIGGEIGSHREDYYASVLFSHSPPTVLSFDH